MRSVLLPVFLMLPLQAEDDTASYAGFTAEQWIAKWAPKQSGDRATTALVHLGEPAVKPLLDYVNRKGPHLRQAFTALSRIGEPASAAIDRMLEIAKDKEYTNPDPWYEPSSARKRAIWALRDARWAHARIIPALEPVLFDASESEEIRYSASVALGAMGEPALPVMKRLLEEQGFSQQMRSDALHSISRMGEGAIPVLQRLADAPDDPNRDSAIYFLAELLDSTGRQSRADFYRARVYDDLANPKVVTYLGNSKRDANLQRRDELTEQVKQALTQRFSESHDPEIALQWAKLVQCQLLSTELKVRMMSWTLGRENPEVSFKDLHEVLRQGFDAAEKSNPLRLTMGRALAKLHLLRGEWPEMNAVLVAMGEAPIDAQLVPTLCAPPVQWESLASSWGECDPALRTGTCAFSIEIQKDGKGLKGAHVLLKKPQPPIGNFSIRTETMLLTAAALETGWTIQPSFGYGGEDRAETRYAVTDESGRVVLENLPEMEMELEVLIPTSNFPESGWKWELWQEAQDGRLLKFGYTPEERIPLKAGKTFVYPKLVVRPHGAFEVQHLDVVDAKEFVLRWEELDLGKEIPVHQELELALAMPSRRFEEAEHFHRIRSAVIEVGGHEWPLGAKGVGELRLIPGNYYTLHLTVRDAAGALLARYGRIAICVPWSHRSSNAPHRGMPYETDLAELPLLDGSMRDDGMHGGGDGRMETTRERVNRYVQEHPDDFEFEYVSVIKAWLDWRNGDAAGARAQLASIAAPLVEGNVARETALRLIRSIDAGEKSKCPLNFGDAVGQVKR